MSCKNFLRRRIGPVGAFAAGSPWADIRLTRSDFPSHREIVIWRALWSRVTRGERLGGLVLGCGMPDGCAPCAHFRHGRAVPGPSIAAQTRARDTRRRGLRLDRTDVRRVDCSHCRWGHTAGHVASHPAGRGPRAVADSACRDRHSPGARAQHSAAPGLERIPHCGASILRASAASGGAREQRPCAIGEGSPSQPNCPRARRRRTLPRPSLPAPHRPELIRPPRTTSRAVIQHPARCSHRPLAGRWSSGRPAPWQMAPTHRTRHGRLPDRPS